MKHIPTPTIIIPADVPHDARALYEANYQAITHGTGKLVLFSCDQKIEHLNRDFYGPSIDPEDNNPEHMFKIANQASRGAFATHLGLIAQYGKQYPHINYIVKMNGKTDLVTTEHADPLSKQLWTIEQLVEFKKNSALSIVGIGYTVYIGSNYENQMLQEAAQLIYKAHQNGLIAILWMYPRGKAVTDERAGDLIAGVAGIAASLGADFAKINAPQAEKGKTTEQWLAIAAQAAGKTKLIISGGAKIDAHLFLTELYNYMHKGMICGTATGRNIHQRSFKHACAILNAIDEIIYDDKALEDVLKNSIK